MNRKHLRKILVGSALAIALVGAALSSRAGGGKPAAPPIASVAPAAIEPFDLAALLSQGPPDVVVITFDDAEHALLGAVPAASYGADDESFVSSAPKARRIVLAGKDPVRVDRLARRLMATGRDVRVLAGGIQAWDEAMAEDPVEPLAGEPGELHERHRRDVALRRFFGDESAAPPPVAAPAAAPVLAAPGAPKKREGC